MRKYTIVVFIFQLLAIANVIFFAFSGGYGSVIPLLFGIVVWPLALILGLVQLGLEYKYWNPAITLKRVTRVLTVLMVVWLVAIAIKAFRT